LIASPSTSAGQPPSRNTAAGGEVQIALEASPAAMREQHLRVAHPSRISVGG
jgi:hypothetical protein